MPYIRSIILSILLCTSGFLMSQSYEPFLKLLSEDVSKEIMEHSLVAFFSENEKVLSTRELAECYHDRGGRWHYSNFLNNGDLKELDRAIFYTNKALEIKQRLTAEEKCAINRTLYNLGLFHYDKGHLKKALTYYGQLLQKDAEYCINEGADYLMDWALLHSTTIHMETGDYLKAQDLLENKIRRYENGRSITDDRPFWFYYKLSEVYMAIDLFSNSDKILFNLSRAQNFLDDNQYECCFYQNRIDQLNGNRLSEIQDYNGSIENHLKVVANLEQNDSVNLAIAHNSLGHSYFKINGLDSAIYHLRSAIDYDQFFDSPFNNLGDIYLSKGEYQDALFAYQQAINRAINKKADINYDHLPSLDQISIAPFKTELLNHLIFKANAWIAYFEFENDKEHLLRALETFTLADQLVDLIREVSNEQESKLYWREQSSTLYMKAVEVCHLLNKPEEAFYFMERNKALLLLEDLTQEEAKDIAKIPQVLAEREFKLKRNIFLEENRLFQADNKKKGVIDSLRIHISESKYRYRGFIDSLNQAYPDYAKYKKEADILTFNELRSNYISDQQVVLHYILNEEDGYGLLTNKDGLILFQLEDADKLNNDIDSLISLLSNGISEVTNFITTSNTLFSNLIPEVIYQKIKGKQLIIVPDYTLQRIPFETLIVDKAKTKYLIEDTEIAYVYSMSLLDHNQGIARNHSQQLLGLAPINFDVLGLVELTNSESEIEGITPIFDGEIFMDDQASKANFLKEVAAPKIIHLATHADMGDGVNPWIAFRDEKMYLKEIYATKNQSEMVVLSACNTLSGSLKRGEGVMSLARGFFYSGAKSVVSSLWPLTDETGSDIMISFYQNLDKGHSKSKALRQAKLNYLNSNIVEELKHPFYWAGLVVVGDNTPLVASDNPIWIYIGIVLVLALLFLFRRKFLKRLQ